MKIIVKNIYNKKTLSGQMEAGLDLEYSKLNHKYSKRLKIQKIFLSHLADMHPKVDLEIPGKESNQSK